MTDNPDFDTEIENLIAVFMEEDNWDGDYSLRLKVTVGKPILVGKKAQLTVNFMTKVGEVHRFMSKNKLKVGPKPHKC